MCLETDELLLLHAQRQSDTVVQARQQRLVQIRGVIRLRHVRFAFNTSRLYHVLVLRDRRSGVNVKVKMLYGS